MDGRAEILTGKADVWSLWRTHMQLTWQVSAAEIGDGNKLRI